MEKYMGKCISSIVNQTYSNLEIILIDDGSTDNTGKICDEWQERDKRIKVIHKENEGSSYARKTGVENATADYLTFVDADDWIDINMYSDMISALLSTGSDIAQCGYYRVYEDGRIIPNSEESRGFKVMGRKEGVSLILEDKDWQSFMCNKIFKKHLFDNIVFPKNICYEDVFIMHVLFHNASQSVYLNYAYYFYYQRHGSFSNADTIQKDLNNKLHWASVIYDRYLFVKQHPQYHEMLQSAKIKALQTSFNFLRHVVDYSHFFPKETFNQQLQTLRSIPFSCRDKMSFYFKFVILVLKIFPFCFKPYRKLVSFYKNIFKR